MAIEIGKYADVKSKGLFTAEDWHCSKCGNVNWARRSTCNSCNASKVQNEQDRAGLGVGFNERGDGEYDSHNSDNGDDDFGRKKNKCRNTDMKKSISSEKDDEMSNRTFDGSENDDCVYYHYSSGKLDQLPDILVSLEETIETSTTPKTIRILKRGPKPIGFYRKDDQGYFHCRYASCSFKALKHYTRKLHEDTAEHTGMAKYIARGGGNYQCRFDGCDKFFPYTNRRKRHEQNDVEDHVGMVFKYSMESDPVTSGFTIRTKSLVKLDMSSRYVNSE